MYRQGIRDLANSRFFVRLCLAICVILVSISSRTSAAEEITISTGEYPPWTSEKLPHGGYINRIIKEAFALEGIQVMFSYMPWKRALEATRVGQFHASSFWGEDESRRSEFIHSSTIDNIYFVFFYQRNNFKQAFTWTKLDELSHLKIGATRGYTYTQEFWDLSERNKLRVSISNDDVTALTRLVNGKIDLFPISEFTGKHLLRNYFTKTEAQNIRIHPKPLSEGKNYLLFSKHHPENKRYAEIFDRNLEILKQQNMLKTFKKELF